MTRRYLERSASTTFLLFFLGIPVYIWMVSIFVELNKRLPKQSRLNPFLIIAPIGYQITYLILFIIGTVNPFENQEWHQIAMLCSLMCIGLTALMLYRFDAYHKENPSSGLLTFIQIWFYPIGIWYLQPRLNHYIQYPLNGK